VKPEDLGDNDDGDGDDDYNPPSSNDHSDDSENDDGQVRGVAFHDRRLKLMYAYVRHRQNQTARRVTKPARRVFLLHCGVNMHARYGARVRSRPVLVSVNAAVALQDVPSTTAAAGADSSSIVAHAHVRTMFK